ncbi:MULTISPECIES: winged helix-turn-helix transcriptional regulator [unclassified Streptomyces]|uniref:winged helix-turn-helix transcriptional regulator n=1 Tax=unclassified Streptomyces TaxID=2593676 RepID=UPI00324CB9E5
MSSPSLRAASNGTGSCAAVHPEVPVRVEYTLTGAGCTLRGPLGALEEWSIAHLSNVSAAQEAYDRAHRPPPPASTERDT